MKTYTVRVTYRDGQICEVNNMPSNSVVSYLNSMLYGRKDDFSYREEITIKLEKNGNDNINNNVQ